MKHIHFLGLALFLLLATNLSLLAQQNELSKKEVDTDNFPEIRLKINLLDPDEKAKSAFELSENGEKLEFDFEQETPEVESAEKNVLILWEDIKTHKGQEEFYKSLLINTIDAIVNPGDAFNISTFDRVRQTDSGRVLLRPLLEVYSDDVVLLKNKVKDYDEPAGIYNSNIGGKIESADLYAAIHDGLVELKNKEGNNILVVFSAGFNNPSSDESTLDPSIQLAQKHRIPVYVIQYGLSGYEHHRLTPIVTATYAKEIRTRNEQQAQQEFETFMNKAVQRLLGQNYIFTFDTETEKDGTSHELQITVDNTPYEVAYDSPAATLSDTINNNKALVAVVAIVLIALVVFVIYLTKQKRKQQQQKEKEQREKIRKEKEEVDKRLEEERLKREEAERKTKEEIQAQLQAQRELQEQENIRKQHEKERQDEIATIKNSYGHIPQIVYAIDNQNFAYSLDKYKISIGRASSNQLVIKHGTISRVHAEIFFQNGAFYIRDLDSTNGTKVGTQHLTNTPYRLRKGEWLIAGDVKMRFEG